MKWFIAWILLFIQVFALEFSIRPVNLALSAPKRAEKFVTHLFKTRKYYVLSNLVRTQGFDYSAFYCRVWADYGSLAKLTGILKNSPASDFDFILNPTILIQSRKLIEDLNELPETEIFSQLPFSFLEASNFQATNFSATNFDAILADAFNRHLHNRRMRWFDWLEDINLGEFEHLSRQWQRFYQEKGWLFICPTTFAKASARLKSILNPLILSSSDESFSQEESSLRRVLYYACSQVTRYETSIKFVSVPAVEFEVFLDLTYSLKEAKIHGDWFVEIIGALWRPNLKLLKDEQMKQLLEFLFDKRTVTVQGTSRLLQFSDDPRIYSFVQERESGEFFTLLQNEFPELPQLSKDFSFKRRWQMFCRNARLGVVESRKSCSGSAFECLINLAGLPQQYAYLPKSLHDVQRVLKAISEQNWFNKLPSGDRVPNCRMPRLFARLLGFFTMLARAYGLPDFLMIDYNFFSPSWSVSPPNDHDLDTFCQFNLSPQPTLLPKLTLIQPPESDDENFDCNCKNDQYLLSVNMKSDFDFLLFSQELVAFSPACTERKFLNCEDDSLVYQSFLKQEFEHGLDMHQNIGLFSSEEIQLILASA